MFVLFNMLIALGIQIIGAVLGTGGMLGGLYSLAVLLPGWAVFTRRMHDIGKSGWPLSRWSVQLCCLYSCARIASLVIMPTAPIRRVFDRKNGCTLMIEGEADLSSWKSANE